MNNRKNSGHLRRSDADSLRESFVVTEDGEHGVGGRAGIKKDGIDDTVD
jgi:hypothetical protein